MSATPTIVSSFALKMACAPIVPTYLPTSLPTYLPSQGTG